MTFLLERHLRNNCGTPLNVGANPDIRNGPSVISIVAANSDTLWLSTFGRRAAEQKGKGIVRRVEAAATVEERSA